MKTMRHWYGNQEEIESFLALAPLLSELDDADPEHPDVSVENEQGWGISAYRGINLVLENVEGRRTGVRRLRGLSREEAVRVLALFVADDWGRLLALAWSWSDQGLGATAGSRDAAARERARLLDADHSIGEIERLRRLREEFGLTLEDAKRLFLEYRGGESQHAANVRAAMAALSDAPADESDE